MLEWVCGEALWLGGPCFADELVRCEAFERLESASEVVGRDEVREVLPELVVALVVESLDGCVLDGAVHPLDLAVIRYVILRCLLVPLFLLWNGFYGEPIRDAGHREH